MPDTLTLTGVVATPPRHITTNAGLDITSFRLASSQRRYDREQQKWIETDTNWYTVTGFRQLAQNLATSIERGQHVVVAGRLRIRPWENAERSGTTVEIEADAVGHDLGWGTAVWVRSVSGSTGDASAERWSNDVLNAGLEPSGALHERHEGATDARGGDPAGSDAEASDEASTLVPF